ncbi:glutamate--tRNA ligase [candidate division WOR-3 bacterium]|nr:glutamate--tRNA ligase [candidate division WOR-3 bacterium]
MSEENVRVRIAPSPTGAIHVGLARTALYNYLFAHKNKGTFVLRIEDTDFDRSTEESAQAIIKGLGWLGIRFDEGPYYQSQRMDLYKSYAEKLLQTSHAYKCYCTQERLEEERKRAETERRVWRYDRRCLNLTDSEKASFEAQGIKPAIRLRIPDGPTTFSDLIHGEITREAKDIDDFVAVRSNGIPTYNFVVVIDDHLMKMTHVLRAVEHISNTFKQVLLYKALGWDEPKFAHLPLILGEDKKKLSKRHGAMSLDEFRRLGYLPDALVNFLALLGWSPGEDREVMTRAELEDLFSLERINTSNAVFDMQKLTWMNGEYMRRMNPEDLIRAFTDWLAYTRTELPSEYATQELLSKAVPMIGERSRTLAEIYDALLPFISDDLTYDESGLEKHFRKDPDTVSQRLKLYRDKIEELDEWTVESTEEALRQLVEELDVKAGLLIHPVRLAVTGRTVGPPLFDCLVLLGRERVLERLGKLPR